jgi:hypothetical protein
MNATKTVETLREIRGLLNQTEKHFLNESGWLSRVNDAGEVVWFKVVNGHGYEYPQAEAVRFQEFQAGGVVL